MDELINRLNKISNLSELENIASINPNELLIAIRKSGKYDLLKDNNIRLNTADKETLKELVNVLFKDGDELYFMVRNGLHFTNEELEVIFKIILEKENYNRDLCEFLSDFFDKEGLNNFVTKHEDFFIENYIEKHKSLSLSSLETCDKYVELTIKSGNIDLFSALDKYSLDNLKLLSNFIRNLGNYIPYNLYYQGSEEYVQHIFTMKDGLNPDEVVSLLSILDEKRIYDRKNKNSDETTFYILVKNNIDYLIDIVTKTNLIPKCLLESPLFRNECIKRNRFDLATKCILSPEIIKDERLVNEYCKELNIEPKDFYERNKWMLDYYEKNNDIYNTVLASSLKDNLFSLNKEHFERFINDIRVQMLISKLNDKEIKVFSKILDNYGYDEYDITLMITSILKNISSYSELINSIDIDSLSDQDLKDLISVIVLPNNEYNIKTIEELKKYDFLKKLSFVDSFETNDLNKNKDKLLKAIFNIDLKEAKYIEYKYCHENYNDSILDNLKNSELPPQIFKYLVLINKIVECDNNNDLVDIFNAIKEQKLYDCEIPLEQYLRSQYTELYSKSLFRIDERNEVYGPKDNVIKQINFNGKDIKICIPRVKFNLFLHCVGSCSLASEVSDSNYRNDWLDRPQIQDHFVACSYINEKGIYSLVSWGSIILGFDTLDNGSILGMGNTDIDSIGSYGRTYDGSRELQEANGNRARFFVPSEMLKTINNGYNEIVVERRNNDKYKNSEFKRKPDYIIMMSDSLEPENFNTMDTLYSNHLPFITDEDKKEIEQLGESRKIKKFLVKYKEQIAGKAIEQGKALDDMANIYVDLIMKAKYFEDCMKAASEFDIPLVIIDKTYYFNKILDESTAYGDETKKDIMDSYLKADKYQRKAIFNAVAKNEDVSKIIKPTQNRGFTISV